ncbi:indole-3-glycerol-phosphate synthase [Methanosalsum natronophilum]|uniref:indole-3-glycerol-phosphate synthase n=1 Tax=Methanosalsum natronophilum TaxID=768733 RepID=UPI0021685FDE|nr:indole-3-glycerol-phosphate synthase [Methanosalsum natronophilum]MCS3922987.1 indole-3-glycerol phosphate synthase [Methanosalsum natronophilum]
MHILIEDIISSTKKRNRTLVKHDSYQTKKNKTQISNSIYDKKLENRVPIIAEVKPSSPKEKLRSISPNEASVIGKDMERAGAVAISVLTEPDYFKGSKENLFAVSKAVSIPILRKDFILDIRQIDETSAEMILLITSILKQNLETFVNEALLRGIEPLVEVQSPDELKLALNTKATFIGINNRNFSTLEVDLNNTEKIAPLIKEYDKKNKTNHIIISESGIRDTTDIQKLMSIGVDAFLIGTSIMKSVDIYEKTKELVDCLHS